MAILIKKIYKILSFLRRQESIKTKASTLIESLVASVIIIVVFTIASLTLNNVFQSTIKNNLDRVQNRMNTLEYLYLNDKISHPYQENFEDWNIQFLKPQAGNSFLTLDAVQLKTKKSISKKLTYVVSQ